MYSYTYINTFIHKNIYIHISLGVLFYNLDIRTYTFRFVHTWYNWFIFAATIDMDTSIIDSSDCRSLFILIRVDDPCYLRFPLRVRLVKTKGKIRIILIWYNSLQWYMRYQGKYYTISRLYSRYSKPTRFRVWFRSQPGLVLGEVYGLTSFNRAAPRTSKIMMIQTMLN
jgi:hypothetical protein